MLKGDSSDFENRIVAPDYDKVLGLNEDSFSSLTLS